MARLIHRGSWRYRPAARSRPRSSTLSRIRRHLARVAAAALADGGRPVRGVVLARAARADRLPEGNRRRAGPRDRLDARGRSPTGFRTWIRARAIWGVLARLSSPARTVSCGPRSSLLGLRPPAGGPPPPPVGPVPPARGPRWPWLAGSLRRWAAAFVGWWFPWFPVAAWSTRRDRRRRGDERALPPPRGSRRNRGRNAGSGELAGVPGALHGRWMRARAAGLGRSLRPPWGRRGLGGGRPERMLVVPPLALGRDGLFWRVGPFAVQSTLSGEDMESVLDLQNGRGRSAHMVGNSASRRACRGRARATMGTDDFRIQISESPCPNRETYMRLTMECSVTTEKTMPCCIRWGRNTFGAELAAEN